MRLKIVLMYTNNDILLRFVTITRYKVEVDSFGSQLVPDTKMALEADHRVHFTRKLLGMDLTPGVGRFASIKFGASSLGTQSSIFFAKLTKERDMKHCLCLEFMSLEFCFSFQHSAK